MKGSTVIIIGVLLWLVGVFGAYSLVAQGNKGCHFFDATYSNLQCKGVK